MKKTNKKTEAIKKLIKNFKQEKISFIELLNEIKNIKLDDKWGYIINIFFNEGKINPIDFMKLVFINKTHDLLFSMAKRKMLSQEQLIILSMWKNNDDPYIDFTDFLNKESFLLFIFNTDNTFYKTGFGEDVFLKDKFRSLPPTFKYFLMLKETQNDQLKKSVERDVQTIFDKNYSKALRNRIGLNKKGGAR